MARIERQKSHDESVWEISACVCLHVFRVCVCVCARQQQQRSEYVRTRKVDGSKDRATTDPPSECLDVEK